MNPVCTYHEFLEFLKYSGENKNKLIPVFLIKPSTILYLNSEGMLDHHFNYFDRRTGKNVQFFLPGYAHYPNMAFAQIFPNIRSYSEDSVALTTRRLGKINYSERAFVEFIEKIENSSPDFIYRGDAELLFIQYIANTEHQIGSFDFCNIYRYNLSKLFYSQNSDDVSYNIRLIRVFHFLEDVIFEMRITHESDDKLIESINNRYDMNLLI